NHAAAVTHSHLPLKPRAPFFKYLSPRGLRLFLPRPDRQRPPVPRFRFKIRRPLLARRTEAKLHPLAVDLVNPQLRFAARRAARPVVIYRFLRFRTIHRALGPS